MRKPISYLVLLALVFASAPVWADSDPAPKRPAAKSLAEMEKRLNALAKRIAALVEIAKKDPDEIRIRIYLEYTPKELKRTRGRDVRAEDILGYMVAADKNFNIREKAKKALTDARWRGDPDLSDSEKQGPRTRRAHFCRERVAKHLRSEDRYARQLAHDLLTAFYSGADRTHPEIKAFRAELEGTWKKAYEAWRRFLYRK